MPTSHKDKEGSIFAHKYNLIIDHPTMMSRCQTKLDRIKYLSKAPQTSGEEARFLLLDTPTVFTLQDINVNANET